MAVGAAETTPVVAVTNLVRTLKLLKDAGLVGGGRGCGRGEAAREVDLKGGVVLVLGAEGSGLRHLTQHELRFHGAGCRSSGAVESLNVSVAAGMLLYEALGRGRPREGGARPRVRAARAAGAGGGARAGGRPRPGADRVRACGVNFLDGLIVQGKYQTKPPLPFSPGAEVAGVIKEVGAGVTGLAPGMRVLAMTGYGGFAEEVVTDAVNVMPLPPGRWTSPPPRVSRSSTRPRTTRSRSARSCRPARRSWCWAPPAAWGSPRWRSARSWARASSRPPRARRSSPCAGSTAPTRSSTTASADLRERVKELTAGKGVDVVYDPVGGAYAEPAVRSLAFLGRYLVIGFASGEIPKIPLNLLLLKQASARRGVLGRLSPRRVRPRTPRTSPSSSPGTRRVALHPHVSANLPAERFP